MNNNKQIKRYAIFNDVIRGNYMIVVRGEFDINHAQKWGGFVSWVGKVRRTYVVI